MTTTRSRISVAGAALLVVASIHLGGCASDESEPDVNRDDEPAFDVDVDDGVGTETDEGRNVGFEDDEPSGNETDINQP
ncbi:hypothetical protein [Ilumatobacter nonamiensis]|uniref:hypothetical protein n=1 Tax=Ilumatobacter nonamiensis TaxID=467093 RepID=UPI000348F2C6|nr:hypothetical protein [Ilumatobacter nonamiensis]